MRGRGTLKALAVALLASGGVSAAHAETMFIDSSGQSPNRVAIFASDLVIDTTPLTDTMGPTEIKEIQVNMVFEALNQPYYNELKLEFQCPNPVHASHVQKKGQPWALPDKDVVTFRMARGWKHDKDQAYTADLTPTNWQQSSSFAMKSIYRIACDNDRLQRYIYESRTPDETSVDMDILRSKMAGMGLGNARYIASDLFMWKIADFTWETLWPDVPKPKLVKGTPLSKEEYARIQADIAQRAKAMSEKIAAIRGGLLAEIGKMDAESEFVSRAAKFRGNRKWTRVEAVMNRAWLTKTEAEVVAAIGRPVITDAGGARFLSYGQSFDNRVVYRRIVGGDAWTEGVFQSCDIQFVVLPDQSNIMRVADVRVTSMSNSGANELKICSGLLNAPHAL